MGTTQSRCRIVAAARDLFHRQGVRATHVDDIIRVAGITRREFHRLFRNKHKVAEEVVFAYLAEIESGASRLHPKLASWSDFKWSLGEHVAFLRKFNMVRGCPLAIVGNELTEEHEVVRQQLSRVFEALTKRMTMFLRKEKTEGLILQSADDEQLAEFCVAVMQGAMLLGKVRGESKTVEGVFLELIAHLEQLRLGVNS